MTDWNQYARDVQAASNAAHNKDQKRIKELESKLAKAVEELAEAEGKLALMIFERDEVMMFERDEAWKRAAHSERMWGEAEVKLAKAVEALVQLERIVGDILGAHLQDSESRDKAIDLIKTTLAELEK